MYRFGRGVAKSKKRHVRKLVFVSFVLLIIVGIFWLNQFMKTGDQPITPQAITREYVPDQVDTHKIFDTPDFHMELPNEWALKEHQTTPYNLYAYQATSKGADNRWLEIYVDNVPTQKAFNRLRPATLTNGVLEPSGQISDNCYEIAGNKPVPQQAFMGINFTCDIEFYTRNVVGVGIAGQGTTMKLGGHTFVIVYIDHNVRPNYQILDDMLKSFSVK